ncbi:SUKH-4 family immunity protein [Streptomyces sp. NPDC001279]|uniref:SUKH-4 family immunity protein n=1 Tax=Streptomyces sp. NPDC001279 TaxID=3364556 RepID=UPI0036773891
MIRIFGPALAPVLSPDEIPEGVEERRARFTLQNIGVPTSIGDTIVTDLCDMRPLHEVLIGIQLPPWARSDNVFKLGLFLDGFLCLDGAAGPVLLLTRDLEESPTTLSSDLYAFVCLLVWIGQATYRADRPDGRDVAALLEEIDPGSLSASAMWERVYENLTG